MARDIDDIVRLAEQREKRKAEKISLFLKLSKDPDIRPIIELFRADVTPNGKKTKTQFTPPVGFKTGNGLRDAIRNLDLPQRVTAKSVWDALHKKQFRFSANDELGAVGDALYAMSRGKNPEFRRVVGEKGVYEKI
jgi:hypothetical protein